MISPNVKFCSVHVVRDMSFCLPSSLLSSAPSDKDMKKGQVLKEEGNALVKKGEHKKAIEKYSQSIKLNPNEITTYTNR